ncbi:hypothetical protein ABTK88_19370, partial [Acinetobacter baumannii]
PTIILLILIAAGLFGARTLFRIAENSFWSLNSIAVEPVYTVCREGMRHIAEKLIPSQLSGSGLAKLRALTALLAGIIVVGASATFLLMV